MTTEMTVFKDKKIRIEVIEGEPCFCLKDICDEVGIKNVGNVIKRLHDAAIRTMDVSIQTDTIMRAMAFVNETGLYSVIGKSRKPKCKELYQQLIAAIPELRKQVAISKGGISTPNLSLQALKILIDNQIALEQRMDKYEAKQQAVTAILAPVKEISTRSKISQIIREYALGHDKDYKAYFQTLFYEFKYRYGIDLVQRTRNNGNKTIMDTAEECGCLDDLFALAVTLFVGK